MFAERLELKEDEILCPEHSELMIAYGAALSLEKMFADSKEKYVDKLLEVLEKAQKNNTHISGEAAAPFFATKEEEEAFKKAHQKKKVTWKQPKKGETVRCFLGIDAGSTTTKFVLLDENEEILDSFYAPNEGDPLKVAKDALISLRKRYEQAGAKLEILSAERQDMVRCYFPKHLRFHVIR